MHIFVYNIQEDVANATGSSDTPFGKRRTTLRKIIGPEKQQLNTGVVDSQLQSIFAQRAKKIEDPDALIVFEEKVQERMETTRASIKQTGKEIMGSRQVDSQLKEKLEKQKNKIIKN